MKNTPLLPLLLFLATVSATIFSPTKAFADILLYTISGTFAEQVGGENSGGLDGADFSFVSEFDLTQPYSGNAAFPTLLASNTTISISGASNLGSNGLYALQPETISPNSITSIFGSVFELNGGGGS